MTGKSFWLGLTIATGALPAGCQPDAAGREARDTTSSPDRSERIPLVILADRLAVCRLDRGVHLPSWATASPGEFFSATRTADELSIILPQSRPPREIKCERDWRLLKVQGPLPLNLVGIIAGLSGTLANAGVSIFAFSTYDTDYVMVKQVDLDRAVRALRQAGYPVSEPSRDR